MERENETFHYTYSAKQQEEIQAIRQKYLPREENEMEKLRRLDRSVTKPGRAAGVTLGITGTLVLGVGMCCTMVWSGFWFIPGIFIGLAGMAGIAAAYPVYQRLTKRRREKLAPEIMRLTEELTQ